VLPADFHLRPLAGDDAPALAAAFARNREHLRPWDPNRAEAFFTVAGQRESIRAQLALVEQGRLQGWVLWHVVEGRAEVAGRYALSNITRGVQLGCTLGYWVDRHLQGRGLASAMVEHACEQAAALGLHRVEAGTMIANAASQAVLRRCGFQHYGTAPDLLYLDGAWRDHHLFQRILNSEPAGGAFL
jgi:ribosomal-protein-alanine N-acetyltransferase